MLDLRSEAADGDDFLGMTMLAEAACDLHLAGAAELLLLHVVLVGG